MTLETVETDIPASFATSNIVANFSHNFYSHARYFRDRINSNYKQCQLHKIQSETLFSLLSLL